MSDIIIANCNYKGVVIVANCSDSINAVIELGSVYLNFLKSCDLIWLVPLIVDQFRRIQYQAQNSDGTHNNKHRWKTNLCCSQLKSQTQRKYVTISFDICD